MQEMKMLAKNYNIPIVSATQGTRALEEAPTMSNSGVADSHKKVRYADNIFMVRMRRDKLITNEDVKKDIVGEEDPSNPIPITSFNNLNNGYDQNVIPYEIKITKAKDGTKDITRYYAFNGQNCRITETLDQVYKDNVICKKNTDKLISDLQSVQLNSKSAESDRNNLTFDMSDMTIPSI